MQDEDIDRALWLLIGLLVTGTVLYLLLTALGISGPKGVVDFFSNLFSLVFTFIWARIASAFR